MRLKPEGSGTITVGCQLLGYSRQAYYKPQALRRELVGLEADLSSLFIKERSKCPGIGCRSIYKTHADVIPIGRDKCEAYAAALGLYVKRPKRHIRTTKSDKRMFDNLLVNKQVSAVNQVWQADMTYYIKADRWYYIMLITDVYSQRIIGYGAYHQSTAREFREVLKQAVATRRKEGYNTLEGLIHHSDGGRQYEEYKYRKYCKAKGIIQSMCYYSWENPYAEKTNDLIKGRYLDHWKPQNLQELRACLAKAVEHHNHHQAKKKLSSLSPMEFEWTTRDQLSNDYNYILNLKPALPRVKMKTVI